STLPLARAHSSPVALEAPSTHAAAAVATGTTGRAGSDVATLPTAATLAPPTGPAVPALVQAAQQGDGAAFAQLYALYGRKIHSYLRYHLAGRTDVAEDLAADVF